jgi:predicted nucleotidyltransferase
MASEAAQINDPKLAEVVRRLVEALQPTRIYLFGSRARGEGTGESDYDLLALVRCPPDGLRVAQRSAYDAIWGVGVSVDVVVMSEEFFDRRRVVIASLPGTVEREGQVIHAA